MIYFKYSKSVNQKDGDLKYKIEISHTLFLGKKYFLADQSKSHHSYIPRTIKRCINVIDERFYFLDTSPKHLKITNLWLSSLECEG